MPAHAADGNEQTWDAVELLGHVCQGGTGCAGVAVVGERTGMALLALPRQHRLHRVVEADDLLADKVSPPPPERVIVRDAGVSGGSRKGNVCREALHGDSLPC